MWPSEAWFHIHSTYKLSGLSTTPIPRVSHSGAAFLVAFRSGCWNLRQTMRARGMTPAGRDKIRSCPTVPWEEVTKQAVNILGPSRIYPGLRLPPMVPKSPFQATIVVRNSELTSTPVHAPCIQPRYSRHSGCHYQSRRLAWPCSPSLVIVILHPSSPLHTDATSGHRASPVSRSLPSVPGTQAPSRISCFRRAKLPLVAKCITERHFDYEDGSTLLVRLPFCVLEGIHFRAG